MENKESQKPFHAAPQVIELNESSKCYYRPWILRFPSMLMLLIITLSLIGLSEYTTVVLPAANSLGLIEGIVEASNLDRRQNYADNYTSTMLTTVSGAVEIIAVTYVDPCPSGEICAPPPQYWLPVGTVLLSETSLPTPTLHSAPSSQFWLQTGTVTLSATAPPLPTQTTGAPSPQFWLTTGSELFYVFTNGQYFIGAFLPTLLAVLFALLWAIIDAKVRDIEPFHQLMKSHGSPASSTLCMDYLSPFFVFAPFKALRAGHWAPLMTSMLSLTSILITPLAPEFVSIRMEGNCDAQTKGCIPSLSTFPAVGRVIQFLLCCMAVITIILIVHMYRYMSGVFAETTSIAGLATLLSNPKVSGDFQYPLHGGSEKQFYTSLTKKQYHIDHYTDQDGSTMYGFAPIAQAAYSEGFLAHDGIPLSQHTKQPAPKQQLKFSHPHRKGAIGLFFVLSCLSALIIYYKLSFTNSGFESFMDSQGFGVRFLFTSVGVIIKLYWSSIFREISNLEPYRQLAKGSSRAEDSILIPKYSIPITSILQNLHRGHFFVALVAWSAFLADALTICLSNDHFNTSTTFAAYTVSTWLSISILGIMLVTLVVIIFHRQPELPLKPNTIAAVLCYFSGSSLPRRFNRLALLGTRARDHIVRDLDLRYGMWVEQDDERGGLVTIDVEPNTENT